MALIKCPECGRIISEYAEQCPQCACPKDIIEMLIRHANEEEENRKRREQERLQREQEENERQKQLDTLREEERIERRVKFIGSIECRLIDASKQGEIQWVFSGEKTDQYNKYQQFETTYEEMKYKVNVVDYFYKYEDKTKRKCKLSFVYEGKDEEIDVDPRSMLMKYIHARKNTKSLYNACSADGKGFVIKGGEEQYRSTYGSGKCIHCGAPIAIGSVCNNCHHKYTPKRGVHGEHPTYDPLIHG